MLFVLFAFWILSVHNPFLQSAAVSSIQSSVCLVSIIRTYMLKLSSETADFTFDNVAVAFWSCVETNATVCVACFMTFKPLLARWFPGLVDCRDKETSLEMARSGRVLTIGSRPVRSPQANLHQSVTSMKRTSHGIVVDIKAD